jgi:hypothetical protein
LFTTKVTKTTKNGTQGVSSIVLVLVVVLVLVLERPILAPPRKEVNNEPRKRESAKGGGSLAKMQQAENDGGNPEIKNQRRNQVADHMRFVFIQVISDRCVLSLRGKKSGQLPPSYNVAHERHRRSQPQSRDKPTWSTRDALIYESIAAGGAKH